MAIGYAYDDNLRLALIVWVGEVTAEDWRAQASRGVVDPMVAAAPRVLADVQLASLHNSVDEEVIGEIADLWGASGVFSGKPLAVVAAGAGFSDAKLFEKAMAEHGSRLIVFNDFDAACVWLGVEPGPVRRHVAQMVAELAG